jgi:fatty-acyl-CoA synthase
MIIRGGENIYPREIEQVLFAHPAVAAHKAPRHWVFTDTFPMTGSGKVQKFRLREQFTSRSRPA